MTSTLRMSIRALAVGFIGYAFVIAFYAAIDLFAGRGVLHTGNLLAQTFFRRRYDPSGRAMSVDIQALLRHNAMHLCVAVTIGFIVIGLVEDAIRNPSKSRFILFTFFLGFVVTIVMMAFLTDPIRPFFPVWTIIVSNAGAAAVAAAVIVRWYPGLWTTLRASGAG